jgi:hypothetical protein
MHENRMWSRTLGFGTAAVMFALAFAGCAAGTAGDASKSPALPTETLTNDVPVHGSPPPQATPTAFIVPTEPLDHMDADVVLDVAGSSPLVPI